MVHAETTKEQNELAKKTGQGLFCFSCKCGGTVSCDGPIPHEIAHPLKRLMVLVAANRVDADSLREFVNTIGKRSGEKSDG